MNKDLLAGLIAVTLVAVIALVMVTKSVNVSSEKSYGGTTNLDSLTLSGTLTSATIAGTGNMTVGGTLGVTGNTTLSALSVTGNSKLGTKSTRTDVYVGTTDGCGVLGFTASGTTPTLTPTSTSFCN
jgi:hypothetical protein